MARPSTLIVPKGDGTSAPDQYRTFTALADLQSLVVIGANGAGKSRFGYAIEKANEQGAPTGHFKVQRISAQRALTVNESVNPVSLEEAEGKWYWGTSLDVLQKPGMRDDQRWGRKPLTSLLNDFEALLQLLFAKTRQRDFAYARDAEQSLPTSGPPEAPAGKLVRLWNHLLPRRRLRLEESKIMVELMTPEGDVIEGGAYNAANMSDGERVALYLMAQALVAPQDSVLVIDEPEIHLHRSIRDAIFDALEAERSDCLFVYITHDVEFAAARTSATKLWIKEFTGTGWLWEIVNDTAGIPPALMAELLGSRRPVLFVEGDSGSLDTLIYSRVYPERYVVPLGSCDRVVHMTKALRADETHHLHWLDATGIIDRDRRTTEEVATRLQDRLFVLDVAESENLLLLPGVILFVAARLGHDPQTKLDAAIDAISQIVKDNLTQQVAGHVHHSVHRLLNEGLGKPKGSAEELEGVVAGLTTRIDIQQIWSEVEADFNTALESRDYETMLCLTNHKGLASRIAPLLGLAKEEGKNGLESFVRRILQDENAGGELVEVYRKALPNLASLPPEMEVSPTVAAPS